MAEGKNGSKSTFNDYDEERGGDKGGREQVQLQAILTSDQRKAQYKQKAFYATV